MVENKELFNSNIGIQYGLKSAETSFRIPEKTNGEERLLWLKVIWV
jgi:hypothetical protein